MKSITQLGIQLISFCIMICIGIAKSDDNSNIKLKTELDAIGATLQITGFDQIGDFSAERGNVTAELKVLPLVKIPFLWREFANKEVWIVTIKSVQLHTIKGNKTNIDPHLRDFTLFLDPISGNLIRLESKRKYNKTDYNPEPPVEEIESQMRYNERIIAIPSTEKCMTFINILDQTYTSPFDAIEIIAYCVTWASNGMRDTSDVWSIDFRGFPPEKTIGPLGRGPSQSYFQGHMRNDLDAHTGAVICLGSVPTTLPPDILEEFRTIERKQDEYIKYMTGENADSTNK